MFNPDIHNDGIRKIEKADNISPISGTPSLIDSGVSSIEKSKSVRGEVIPPMDSPILIAPSNSPMAFIVAAVDVKGVPVAQTVRGFILQNEEIKKSVAEGWLKNLREIEEYVRQILSSPVYQQLQELRMKDAQREGNVSSIDETSGNQSNLLSTLDRLQVMEKVSATEKVTDTSAPQDSTRVLVLPLTAALLIGGGLSLGIAGGVQPGNPIGGMVKYVQQLQPLFPQVGLQDLIPLINLMVVGPIYYGSWKEALNNFKGKEARDYFKEVHNFAKDVIKLVVDPYFVQSMLIKRLKGVENLSQSEQDRLVRMLKVLLIGVALSLLYSLEVGKIQKGQFWGIEPEELRDLLTGKLATPPDPSKKTTEREILVTSLINRAWEQLNPLSREDREEAANLLLNYVNETRELDPMLDPAKVFDEAVSPEIFNVQDKINLFRA